ncbi:MAG: outer membrane lipoprotein carrier protein LolA [Acidobacteria bacterium]|nr:outer membrane lipoprotein carrier protein LolA [Acidobacteriota bacterium]
MRINFAASLLLVCADLPVSAQNANSVLARMDTAAAGFQSVAANVQRVSFTAVINDRSEESGTVKFFRAKNDVRVLMEIQKPDKRAFAFAGRQAQLYYPKINTVQIIDLSKQKSLVDQFILLGFGTPGRELAKNYEIRYGGEEPVAGQKASRLELTPKSKEVRQQFAKIEIWVADPGGYAVQHKMHEPSGNYLTATFTDVKLNSSLSPASVALQLPKDVKKEYPQK